MNSIRRSYGERTSENFSRISPSRILWTHKFFFQNPEFILKHFPGPYEKSFKNPLDSASSNPFNPLISYQFYQKASLKLKIFSDILRPEFDPFKTRINRKLTVTAQNGR